MSASSDREGQLRPTCRTCRDTGWSTRSFDGVITPQNVDDGALVGIRNTLIYRIAQIDTLPTDVNAPQPYVTRPTV